MACQEERPTCQVCGFADCTQHCPVCHAEWDGTHSMACPSQAGVYPVPVGYPEIACDGCGELLHPCDPFMDLPTGVNDAHGDPLFLFVCLGCAAHALLLNEDA